MKQFSYNKEIKIATAQLIDVFNNIVVSRRDSKGNLQKKISVPCLYGARSRILKSLENRSANIKLPILAITITGLSRNRERVHSVNEGLIFQTHDPPTLNYEIRHNAGIPIDIEYELSIIAKYQDDIDRIISNFSVNMNPDIYVVWSYPYATSSTDSKIKSQVVWNGNFSIDYPTDISETDPYRIVATTSFTYKTWFFPGTGISSIATSGLIKYINLCGHDNNLYIECPSCSGDYLHFWYDTKTLAISSFLANVEDGKILGPNYDSLPIHYGISGNYWIDISGDISGTVYNPKLSADLTYLISHSDDPALILSSAHGYVPDYFYDVDWNNIWKEMLSGDLSTCFN